MKVAPRRQSIVDMDCGEARAFLLKHESYCNTELPPYFQFGDLLQCVDTVIAGKSLSEFWISRKQLRESEGVNYRILKNRDGKYQWRPMDLIHPALYVSLVNEITTANHWNHIRKRLQSFAQNSKIKCLSLPVQSLSREEDKAEQISQWWQDVEQKSIEFSSYIQKLWMSKKKSVSLSVTINPRGPSDEGERIRSMKQYTASEVETIVKDEVTLSLEALIRVGARRMLQAALEFEVDAYVENLQDERDEQGHRQVVKNGAHKPRDLLTGMGPIPIRQPRVHDRREGKAFRSAILPRYMRRAPSIDALIPALYLKGVSTSSFPEALAAILGEQAPGLSPANVVRLKQIWEQEYQAWRERDLSDKHYVYVWADGIYFQVRLEPDRPCVLVLIGATRDGRKELLAIEDGHRESKLSWQNVLTDLKRRGLKEAPALAIGDGGLGFWAALEEVFPQTHHQRCWVHKSANVLDKLPKTVQAQAKAHLHQMYLSPTRQDALGAYEDFLSLYEPKYPKACACLEKDKDVLFTFYDFPAAHWRHLRSTNPIESTFSTVRHRTRQTKGCGSRNATMMMVYKLADQAQKHWHRLHGHKLIELVVQGVEFKDGDVKAAA